MKKILVNAFHSDWAGSRVTRRWADELEGAGFWVRRLDHEFDPSAEQAAVEEASALVLLHPFHWYSGPWCLKKWIDEVLTYGWAYGGPDRLREVPWVHAISVGARREEYGAGRSRAYEVEEFLRPFERTAGFCGAKWMSPFLAYGGGVATEEELEASTVRLAEWLTDLSLSLLAP